MNPILIISGDSIPPVTTSMSGAAMRAWGLGEGLRSAGFSVEYGILKWDGAASYKFPEGYHLFTTEALDNCIRKLRPAVVVFQHWPLLLHVSTPTCCPIVLDLHGPLLLEMAYQERSDYEFFLSNKLKAFHKADFVTCAGYRQQTYFRAWMIAAGFDVRDGQPAIIPISLSPDVPKHEADGELTFVFGGHFLPWQDPSTILREVAAYCTAQKKGIIQIFGGLHPGGQIPAGVYEDLIAELSSNERVVFKGMVSREELLAAYRNASVALDCMQSNPERELAFTTRTIEYLWCGLPVIYHDYADLSSFIADNDAGWVIDPSDTKTLTHVLDEIFNSPAILQRKSVAAQQLVKKEFNWEKTITPLAQFCKTPSFLTTKKKLAETLVQLKQLRISLPDAGANNVSYLSGEGDILIDHVQQLQDHVTRLDLELERLRALEYRLHHFLPYRIYQFLKKRFH